MDFHKEKKEAVLKELNTTLNGLSKKEASERLEKYGANKLKETYKISILKTFLNQFKSFLVIILIIAAVISALIGEFIDGSIILAIVILNAILGLIQEYKAEKSIQALKKLEAAKARVIRGDIETEILAENLVPGDIVILEAGNKVPADCRLLEVTNFKVEESALTGESKAVSKMVETVDKDSLADQKNMVFSGTLVVRGKAKVVVVKTGMGTEIGKIASLVQEIKKEETPLQKKLNHVAKFLGVAVIAIALVVFLLGGLFGIKLIEIFLASISLAVAAVPEGLPAVVTISLAFGVKRMVSKNALMKKLSAVETLGTTQVICCDKTGTLTKNEMTVTDIYVNRHNVNVEKDKFLFKNIEYPSSKLDMLLRIAASCNNALLDGKIGDPTELALLAVAKKVGFTKEERIDEIPFEAENKYMATFHKDKLVFVKGAPEIILEKCKSINLEGRKMFLTGTERQNILEENERMARNALRVLGFAYSTTGKMEDLVFVGLMGMIDPPREGVKEALALCKRAGIKVVMITGDHKLTAMAIGRELGFTGKCVTGEELVKMSDEELREVSMFARVNPEHKVKILNAYKEIGVVAAMTGDGVNDAPALKRADIGIAMGITGTDVSKEAADMVLLDDNFTSIVNAVEEGRGIYDNIKKFVGYLISSNLGEVLVVFLAIILNFGLPLNAIQLLWMNLVTDGLPALALSEEPKEMSTMLRKPRSQKEKIITRNNLWRMLFIAAVMTAGTLFVFKLYGQTAAFTTLVLLQMFNVLNYKSEKSVLNSLFNNKWLILAILSSVVLQIAIIYTPVNSFFRVDPLSFVQWLVILGVSASVLVLEEIRKVFVSLE
ncbi:MAG: calcium-translocating P-type ATPase, SERCA-type [Candidatus Woesearchaeota archaeon]|nr:MAG: calcium-translocating P-type ATPase, SERCA-type [Candidatus Woesearchaeota archaeon]